MNAPPPSEPPSCSTSSRPPTSSTEQDASSLTAGAAVFKRAIFLEFFSGSGNLSAAVRRFMDVQCDDLFVTNGTDFADEGAVSALYTRCREIAKSHVIFFHVAPPCSSFSRARDRSRRTRLRSSSQPAGFNPEEPTTQTGNRIAQSTAALVTMLVNELGAMCSWEQPLGSYMMPYLDTLGALDQVERRTTVLDQCRFGRPYRKPTAFYTFGGLTLPSLDRRCTPKDSCGRAQHVELGFGKASTQEAATYPPQLCSAYAADLKKAWIKISLAETARDRVVTLDSGHVKRHVDRGTTSLSAREVRDAEDLESKAGCRSLSSFSSLRLLLAPSWVGHLLLRCWAVSLNPAAVDGGLRLNRAPFANARRKTKKVIDFSRRSKRGRRD